MYIPVSLNKGVGLGEEQEQMKLKFELLYML